MPDSENQYDPVDWWKGSWMTRQKSYHGEIPFVPISEIFSLKRKLIHYCSLIQPPPTDVQVNQFTTRGVLWSMERPSELQGSAQNPHRI